MKERAIDYDDLPMHSLWDGSSIKRTKNCTGCEFLEKVKKAGKLTEICSWGVAWKSLENDGNPKRCGKIRRDAPALSSSVFIKIIKENKRCLGD